MFSLKSMTKLEDLTVLDYTGGWVGAMTPIPTTAKNVAVFVCSMDNESVVISILWYCIYILMHFQAFFIDKQGREELH